MLYANYLFNKKSPGETGDSKILYNYEIPEKAEKDEFFKIASQFDFENNIYFLY